jgi:ferritin-like metal-binding protein YciE
MRTRREILDALNDGISPFTEETAQQSKMLEAILEVLLDIREMQSQLSEKLAKSRSPL